MTPRPLIAIYADESCLGNGREGDNPGGAGALVEYQTPNGAIVRRDLWISEPSTTNNRMALRSVIESMRAVAQKGSRFRIVFCSDSRYIVDGMTTWVHGWAKREWKRKTGPIENLSLWWDAIRAAREHEVAWRWVRGHNDHAQNEYANDLAVRAAQTQTNSDGLVESGFDPWLAAKSVTKVPPRADTFPSEGTFRPASQLPQVPVAVNSQ